MNVGPGTRSPNGWIVPVACVALAASLRIPGLDLVRFMADEENLLLTTRDLVRGVRLPLLGADIGPGVFHWGHLGPLVYYLQAIPYALSSNLAWNLVFFAAFSLVAVGLTYSLGRAFFGPTAGAVACLLHAVSPYPWFIARELKDPSFLPPFVCLFFLALALLARERKGWAAVFAAGAFACVIQFHVTTVLFALPLLVVIVAARPRLATLAAGALLAACLLGPYLVGQVQEGFADAARPFQAVSAGTGENGSHPFSWEPLRFAFTASWRNFHEPYLARPIDPCAGWIEMGLIVLGLAIAARRTICWLARRGDGKRGWPAALSLAWFLPIPLALGIQGQTVYARHLIPLYPVQFLLAGLAVGEIFALAERRRKPIAKLVLVGTAAALFFVAGTQASFIGEYKAAVAATGQIAGGLALREKREIVSRLVAGLGVCASEADRIHCPDLPEQSQGFRYLLDVAAPACSSGPIQRGSPPRPEFAVLEGSRLAPRPLAVGPGIEIVRTPTYAIAAYLPRLDRTSLRIGEGAGHAAPLGERRLIATAAPRLVLSGRLEPGAGFGFAELVLHTNACPSEVRAGETILYSHDCEARFRDDPWEVPYRFDLTRAPEGGNLSIELRNIDTEVMVEVYDVRL